MKDNPKISIVTPVYDCAKYIETCILSVKDQSYQNYEHIIIDGGSTDGTLDVIKKYETVYPMKWISEPDKGMYDAINKGFSLADGDIYAWLNADDQYMPHAFDTVATVMKARDIQWCTGFPVVLDDIGRMYEMLTVLPIYLSKFLQRGYHDGRIAPMVQQESTFWTRQLWERAGGVDIRYKYAGDHWLWREFARYETLYTLDTVLAGFRRHEGQKTSQMDRYWEELGKYSLYKKFLARSRVIKFLIYMQSLGDHRQLIRMHDHWE